jgi:hypothetical protein
MSENIGAMETDVCACAGFQLAQLQVMLEVLLG